MKLEKITIRNIGVFDIKEVIFPNVVTVIEGLNASGKSTVLNSILFLCHMPTKPMKQLKKIESNTEYIAVRGSFSFQGESVSMIIEAVGGYVNGILKKKYLLNKIKTYRSQIRPFPSCLIFNPEMVSLFTSSSSNQRKFWIRLIEMLDPTFTANWNRYWAIIRNRNNILKKIAEGKAKIEHLSVWSEKMVESVAVVEEQIIYWLTQINTYLHSISDDIELSVDIVSTREIVDHLDKNIQVDIRKGYTSVGLHFFTVKLLLAGKDISLYGSRGQSKLVCVKIIVALSNLIFDLFNEYPILLIDDMGAELDSDNIQIMEKLISNPEQQKIITTIDISSIPKGVRGEVIQLS